MSIRRGSRALALVWAVLQFALPTVATFADVLLERESATTVAHAESRTDQSCRPVHSAECALCQVVQRAGTPERATELPPCEQQSHAPAEALDTQVHSVDLARQHSPRAPPVAS